MLYAWLRSKRTKSQPSWTEGLAGAGITAATAYAIDYTITPERLRPGYEHRLSRTSLAYSYVALAVGLALGCAMADRGLRKTR